MKLLLIHAARFEFKVREKAVSSAEDLNNVLKEAKTENALVSFITVEKQDANNINGVVSKACEAILDVYRRVKAETIVIYPYAHLSSSLASPEAAIKILKAVEQTLKENNAEVIRAPFGWYKEFTIKCYGHPLAELSRSISAEPVKEEPKPQEKAEEYAILTPDGELVKPEEYRDKEGEEDFRQLVEKEALKQPLKGGAPRYFSYCKKFGIEWEPASDVGHMRFSPEATLIMDVLSEYSWMCAESLGIPVFKVRGTNMFDLAMPAVKQHAELYGDRLYEVDTGQKRLVLRYAACHQQFAMIKDWVISYRNLPFGAFELADSYRLEQPGELLLCFRMRKFHMPDLHIFCRDLEEAKQVSLKVHRKIYEEIKKIGRDYVSIYNTTKSFLKENMDYVLELVRHEGKPVLLHFVEENKYYWVLNIEYNIIDELGRPREIGTFQIDIGNAERFNIKYVGENGEQRYPVIIHTALIGSIERYLYALLDTAALMEKRGEIPRLPTWVAPVQVRIIPVDESLIEEAVKLAEKLASRSIRVDVDDRRESVSKRVRDAEVKWIPYIVVLGRKEVSEGKLSVRIRGSKVTKMSVSELEKRILKELEGYPKLRLTMPMLVSHRPVF